MHCESFNLDATADRLGVSQQANEPPLPAGVAIDVALGGLDGSVASEQLNVAQAAAATVDVSRRGGDEGPPAGMG